MAKKNNPIRHSVDCAVLLARLQAAHSEWLTALSIAGNVDKEGLPFWEDQIRRADRGARDGINRLLRICPEVDFPSPPNQLRDCMILGIWPDDTLDTRREATALYNSGYPYRALVGARATKAGIWHELQRHQEITTIEVGAHGVEEGIYLADGLALPIWWAKTLARNNVSLAILMACDSDTVGDALLRVGIRVISVAAEIDDQVAGEFIKELVNSFQAGATLQQAFEDAKLLAPPDQAVFLSLRG